jgi:hypothetical protein
VDYYVFKNNEQVGPFPLMDVRERLKSGDFTYEDLAWHEGMTDWTPLKEILGGALPDATPHSVSESTPRAAAPSPTAPGPLRLVTSIVVFVVAFAVIGAAAWLVASFVCAVIVAAQGAFSQRVQGTSALVEAGTHACQSYFWIFVVGAVVFSLVFSPVVAWMMAYSNLFHWCRAR